MPVRLNQRYAALRCPRSVASSALLLAARANCRCSKARKGAIIAAKPLESDVCRLMRPSHSNAGRSNGQAGSDGDTRLASGYIIYDDWCNRARRGADSTVVVASTGATSGSGPWQDAAGTLLLSVHDRSRLSSCRAKSAGSVSRSESRTTEQLNSKI